MYGRSQELLPPLAKPSLREGKQEGSVKVLHHLKTPAWRWWWIITNVLYIWNANQRRHVGEQEGGKVDKYCDQVKAVVDKYMQVTTRRPPST